MILEACISTIEGLKAAQKFSLDRVEICKDLHLEGLTPSLEIQSLANSLYNGERYVMIRPHNNGFQYNQMEIKKMKRSIKTANKNGAHGVVFGVLNEHKIDFKKNEELINIAKGLNLKCTFHKAFDQCQNIEKSLIELSEIGFDWVLTSGGEKNAELGLSNLRCLASIKNKKIKILAGGGISEKNCSKFLDIGLDGIHFSIDKNKKIDKNKISSILEKLAL
jgi:copper homeostasis protein